MSDAILQLQSSYFRHKMFYPFLYERDVIWEQSKVKKENFILVKS